MRRWLLLPPFLWLLLLVAAPVAMQTAWKCLLSWAAVPALGTPKLRAASRFEVAATPAM